jgi:hypothetical protein
VENPVRSFYASLTIQSDRLSAKEIAGLLNSSIGELHERGETQSSRPGSKALAFSWWRLSSDLSENKEGIDDSESIEKHLHYLLSFMEQREHSFITLAKHCDCVIRCCISFETGQCALTLERGLLQRLARFPVDLFFDLYS